MPRRRADTLLAERGLAPSRTAAAATVRAGRVRLAKGGSTVEKPSELVDEKAELVVEEGEEFVSRGGIKLKNAFEELGVEVPGKKCLDVGASTGGFTDCLLQQGAEMVLAVDVGYGQLDWKLRNDPRVHVIERRNARELDPAELPFVPSLATIDVSFISLRKVIPAVARCVSADGSILAMVKPQFELGPARVGKGGVVRDAAELREAVLDVARAAEDAGLAAIGFASSGLPGPKGNRETFVHLAREDEPLADLEAALLEVEP